MATVDAGAVLPILHTQEGWYEVPVTSVNNVNGTTGWISAGDVEVVAAAKPSGADADLARRIHELQVQLDQRQSLHNRQVASKSPLEQAQEALDRARRESDEIRQKTASGTADRTAPSVSPGAPDP